MSEIVKALSGADMKEENLKGHGLVLVDFWAPWCGPCRMVAPVVEQLATEYAGKIAVGKLNVDDEPEVAMKYGVGSIPTLIVFKDGAEVDRVVGAHNKAFLSEMLNKHAV